MPLEAQQEGWLASQQVIGEGAIDPPGHWWNNEMGRDKEKIKQEWHSTCDIIKTEYTNKKDYLC